MENKKVIGILKVLFLVFYLSTTAMLLWQYLEILTITDVTSKGLSIAVYLIFFVLIIACFSLNSVNDLGEFNSVVETVYNPINQLFNDEGGIVFTGVN